MMQHGGALASGCGDLLAPSNGLALCVYVWSVNLWLLLWPNGVFVWLQVVWSPFGGQINSQ